MSEINDFWELARQLPPTERADLAHRLLLSLEPEDLDPEADAAWAAELEARLAKVAQGDFVARDWREALADIRKSLSEEPPTA